MSTIFLEAFEQLSGLATIDSQEEDLHSVFRERAELMSWAATSNDRPLLWSMEEAEITADTEPDRIGWVQVGLDIGPFEALSTPTNPVPGWAALPMRRRSTKPAMALPALVQCLSDSLGHTRVRRAQLPDCRGAEPAGGGCVAPAKVIVARQKWLSRQLTSCRTYAVRNQQSEKESKRQNLLTHPARMVDAVHQERNLRYWPA